MLLNHPGATAQSSGFLNKPSPYFLLCALLLLSSISINAQIPSFPGALGYGAQAIGGRGGRVIEVTNLKDNGPGSLRDALEANGPRIVIFTTGGEIKLDRPINIKKSFVTVAGQTAPGDGITISGREIIINSSDVIIRGLKIRVGSENYRSSPDGIAIVAKKNTPIKNVIIDHCTVSWGIDENFAVNGVFSSISNVTLSNNISTEALNDPNLHGGEEHAMGMLVSRNATKFSVIGNLFIHNNARQPKFAEFTTGEAMNNVVYNWGNRATDIDRGAEVNLIGNYYKQGPSLNGITKGISLRGDESPDGKVYVKDNIGPGREDGTGNEWNIVQGPQSWQSNGLIGASSSGATSIAGLETFDYVLDNAGALPRDAHDNRVIQDARNGTGSIILSEDDVGGYLILDKGTPPSDTDKDGMPDNWETSKGLNPNNAADGNEDRDGDGYTNIEEYINSFFLGAQSNTAPTISTIADQTINQDEVLGPLDFTVDDAEIPADQLIVTASSNKTSLVPGNAILLSGNDANRQVTITPNQGAFGEVRITLTVSDGVKETSTSFKVIVQEVVNTPPTISNIADHTIDQDEVLGPLSFTIGDNETSTDQLTVTASSNQTSLVPSNAILLDGTDSDWQVTVTPVAGEFGEVRLTITVSDGTAQATTSFKITIQEVVANVPPTISSILDHTINQDNVVGPLNFTVDDAETPADQLIVTASSSQTSLVPDTAIALGGTGVNRTVTVTPLPGAFGQAAITLMVSDGNDQSTTSFGLVVQEVDSGVNTPPLISNIPDQTIQVNSSLGPLVVTVDDIETSPDSLIITASSGNTNLVLDSAIVLGGNGTDRGVTITPISDQLGEAQITMTVYDGTDVASSFFTVTVEDSTANTPPIISGIADQTMNQDEVLGPLDFTVGDIESPADQLIVTASSNRTSLIPISAIQLAGTGTNRQVTVAPVAGGFGEARITLTVSDGSKETFTSFKVAVTEIINTPPTISNIDDQTIDQDQVLAISFSVDDQESSADQLIVSAVSDNQSLIPDNVIVFSGTGNNRDITITPLDGEFGQAIISVSVSDGERQSTTTFNLVVNERINTAPTISTIPEQVIAQDEIMGPVTFFVNDFESPVDDLLVTGSSNRARLVLDSNIQLTGTGNERTIIIVPEAGEFGDARITLVVSDGELEATKSFKLVVKEKSQFNTPPTISSISDQQMDQDDILGPIDFTIGDTETPENQLTISAMSSDNNIVSDFGIAFEGSGASRSLLISPEVGQFGQVTITVTVSDGTDETTTTFELNINQIVATNTPPVVSSISDQVMDQDQILGPISFTIDDNESSANSLIVSATSNNPSLVGINEISLSGSGKNRAITVAPKLDQFGEVTISVKVSDGSDESASSFKVIVNQVINTTPMISELGDYSIFSDQLLGPLPFIVDDLETPNSLTLSAASSNPTIVNIAGIELSGSGSNRNITVRPEAGRAGTTTITVNVSDGRKTASTFFELQVQKASSGATNTSQALNVELDVKDVKCSGENTGSITAAVNGGAPPYDFSWSTGATTSQIENLSAGVYSVTISDANDRIITKSVTLSQVPEMEIISDVTSVSCNSGSGSISVTVSGGNSPYTYNWSNGANTQKIDGLMPGSYTVKVIDGEGCQFEAVYSITGETDIPIPSITKNGDTLITSTEAEKYQWFKNGQPISGAESQSYLIDESNVYSVMVTNQNGCTAISDSFFSDELSHSMSVLQGLELYPNPAEDEMFIRILMSRSAQVTTSIYGVHGNLVSEDSWGSINRGQTDNRIDISSLKSGYYIIKVRANNGITFRRFYKK